MPQSQQFPAGDSVRSLHLSDFDLRFDRYRLNQPKADLLMGRSLAKYDQLAPVIYCQLEGSLVLVDGFKRLRAARTLKGMTSLQARVLEVDEQGAKAAIFNLNLVTSKPNELEESWIIYALVHDDGLPQIEVAQMLGRHKSWVNRRLALIERLSVNGSKKRYNESRNRLAWKLDRARSINNLFTERKRTTLKTMAKATQTKLPQRKLPQPNQPNPNHRETILHYLEVLKMKLKAEQLDSFLHEHAQGKLSVLESLVKFLEIPAHASQETAIAYRIKRAGFPTEATLESYDWSRTPTTIVKEPFLELATGEFIRRKENAAFVGESGLGKTHLMQSVARKCCALGYRVRYETSASLIEALNGARAIKALTPKVRYYCSWDLLIIDEFGFDKLERKEVPDALSLLYKVIDGRNRRSSTAVITNVNFDDWTEYLGDPPMTMALLDRVVDQTNLIKFEGESIRGDALRKQKKASEK